MVRAVPTELGSLLVNPFHFAADLSEHRGEEGASCQDAVWRFTQQPGLDLLRPHAHAGRVKVRRVLLQPAPRQPGQRVGWDGVLCHERAWKHSGACERRERPSGVSLGSVSSTQTGDPAPAATAHGLQPPLASQNHISPSALLPPLWPSHNKPSAQLIPSLQLI